MIQEVASSPQDPNKDSHTTLTKVTSAGDAAVVEQRYEMTTKKSGPDGTMRDIRLITLSTDTWVHSNGSWSVVVASGARYRRPVVENLHAFERIAEKRAALEEQLWAVMEADI